MALLVHCRKEAEGVAGLREPSTSSAWPLSPGARSRGCSRAELPGAVRCGTHRGSGGGAGRAGRRSRTHTQVVGRLTPSEWGLSSAALLQMPRSRDSRQPHYPQTSLPPSSDPPPDDGLSQQRPDTNATSPHWHRDSDTVRLPQQGPGFTRQTRPCGPKGQQCRLVRRPRPTGLSPGPSLRRLCTALGPGLRGGQGSRSVEVHDRRPGPTRVPGRRLGASASVPCAVEAQGSRLGLSRPHPAAGGHPSPTQLYVATQHWVRCLSFSRSR